ncbi:MAG: S8 family peptidase [Elusimicrobia bacterium]|nr:S8 family peptidase [Elusimicrobiota bacterium]
MSLLLALGAGKAQAAVSAQDAADKLIVAFKPGLTDQQQRQFVEAQGLKVVDALPALRVLLVQAPAAKLGFAQFRMMSDPKVLMVGADTWRDDWLSMGESALDPLSKVQQSVKELPKFKASTVKALDGAADGEAQWGIKRVNAPAAWPSNQGAGVKVAIIDTGIDPTVPDLKGRVAGGTNAIDDKAPWVDDHFHGTHVAGIVAAELDGKGVVGVAPKATLYAVKVLTKEGSGDMFGIMRGIMWTGQNGISVANMSLGAPQEMPLIQYALQMAVGQGVSFACAAGNDGKAVNWPAAFPECIAVSASCPEGITETKLCLSTSEGIAAFSSRGSQVAFIAPGVKIPSTVPTSNDPSNVHAYSGTSMATPHVTGLAALAVAKGAKGPAAVRAALKAAAEPLPGLSSSEQGSGMINAAKLAR